MKRFISRRDIVFAVLIVLAAAAAMFFCRRTAPEGVLITLHGQEYSFVPFSGMKPGEETELNVGGVKVRIGRGYSYIAESDCAGGDCVRTGRLAAAGDTAVCLPNGVAVRITGSSDYDARTG